MKYELTITLDGVSTNQWIDQDAYDFLTRRLQQDAEDRPDLGTRSDLLMDMVLFAIDTDMEVQS